MSGNGFLTTWLARTGKLPRWATILIGVCLLCAAGFLDLVTGPQIALSVLYVVPVTWMTWQRGRWMGLGMALASGATWLWAELATHTSYANELVPYWNALVRTTLFCLISALESEVIQRKRVEGGLRQTQQELEERVQKRTAQLQALNASLEQQVAERSAAAEERAGRLAKSEADLQAQTDILQSILSSMGDGVGSHDLPVPRNLHDRDVRVRFMGKPLIAKDEPLVAAFPKKRVGPASIVGRQELPQRGGPRIQ